MGRILGIDYGRKRCGIATTDPLQIIVTGLETLATENLLDWLAKYAVSETVEKIVIGEPRHIDGNPTYLAAEINTLIQNIAKILPGVPVVLHDEAYSSTRAKEIILRSGARQKKRRDKSLVDKIAAVVILQDYLGH